VLQTNLSLTYFRGPTAFPGDGGADCGGRPGGVTNPAILNLPSSASSILRHSRPRRRIVPSSARARGRAIRDLVGPPGGARRRRRQTIYARTMDPRLPNDTAFWSCANRAKFLIATPSFQNEFAKLPGVKIGRHSGPHVPHRNRRKQHHRRNSVTPSPTPLIVWKEIRLTILQTYQTAAAGRTISCDAEHGGDDFSASDEQVARRRQYRH